MAVAVIRMKEWKPYSGYKSWRLVNLFYCFVVINITILITLIVVIRNVNKTEWSPVCNHTSHNKIGQPCIGSPICLLRIWWQNKFNHKKQFQTKELPSYIGKGKFALKYWQRRRKLFNVALKLRLVDLCYNVEYDWRIEPGKWIIENRSFVNQSTVKEIVIFMITSERCGKLLTSYPKMNVNCQNLQWYNFTSFVGCRFLSYKKNTDQKLPVIAH